MIDGQPFRFVPGQFVAIDANLHRLGYRRSPYCIFSAPSDDRIFQLLVRTVPIGPMSLFLTGLDEGDVVGFRGPTGHSMSPRLADTELILLATGVGLGPCHSLISHLAPTKRRMKLYWGLRLETDICLTDELDELARANPAFSFEIALSRPPPGWSGLPGRITESVPPRLETLGHKIFYLTSNGRMIAEMKAALEEKGVPAANIYVESFFEHRHRPSTAAVRAIRDRFVATDLVPMFTSLND